MAQSLLLLMVVLKLKMVSSLPRAENGLREGPEDVTDCRSHTFVDAEGVLFDASFSAAGGSIILWILYPVSAVR